jgi:hypothetical protein
MGCEFCHYVRGHHPQCPEADDRVEVFWCMECKEPIHIRETFYRIGKKKYCQSCIDSFRDVVEPEDFFLGSDE